MRIDGRETPYLLHSYSHVYMHVIAPIPLRQSLVRGVETSAGLNRSEWFGKMLFVLWYDNYPADVAEMYHGYGYQEKLLAMQRSGQEEDSR